MGEIRIGLIGGADPAGWQGFKRIEAGPDIPAYARVFPVSGMSMGYNDHKAIEVHDLMRAIAANNTGLWPNFRDGHQVQRHLDALALSAAERRWVALEEIG